MSERESHAVTAAVWIGSLVVVGGPTASLVGGAAMLGLDALPLAVDDRWIEAASALAGLAIGLVTATEVAYVRVHGWDVLQRGTRRRRLLRHGVLAIPALVLLAVLAATTLAMVRFLSVDSPAGVAVALASALVFGFVLLRVVRAFLAGRRAALDSEERRIASRILRK